MFTEEIIIGISSVVEFLIAGVNTIWIHILQGVHCVFSNIQKKIIWFSTKYNGLRRKFHIEVKPAELPGPE